MEVNIESLFPSIRQGGLATGEEDLINSTYVGIDFGTSTTVVSVAHFDVESKKIITEPLWLNQKLEDGTILSNEKVPTVIAWRNQNLLIGTGAANLKFELKKGKNVWYSFKMELGEDHGAMYYQSELDGNNGAYKIINPIDAAKIFFQYLNAQIKRHVSEKGLSTNIKYAVSIPASFEANQRRELIEALEHNGMRLNSQSLIDEPNAAFLSYVQNASEEGNSIYIPEDHYPNLLVFDFGAGTCDISILELGNNLNGVYSKNLSISRFEKLGGDDIDRLIAIELLFPALLNENNLTAEDFLTPEKRRIIQRLLKPAEELKIEICQDIALKMHERILPETASSEEFVSLGGVITIDTNKHGKITLTKPKISYAQFHEVMKHFLRTDYINPYRTEIVEGEFSSVFSPIETALNKAGIDRDDIDYVLFIGGSSKNPYVQAALKNYFSESELLIPRDLQTHVSEGA
ncbi:MAG: Hsp70 family protein, partial [Deltaproteobacteria bacterium]